MTRDAQWGREPVTAAGPARYPFAVRLSGREKSDIDDDEVLASAGEVFALTPLRPRGGAAQLISGLGRDQIPIDRGRAHGQQLGPY